MSNLSALEDDSLCVIEGQSSGRSEWRLVVDSKMIFKMDCRELVFVCLVFFDAY